MAKSWGEKWECIKPLSEGGQAHTYLVKSIAKAEGANEEVFVLKKLKNARRLGRFRQEIEACMMLDHPHILKIVDRSDLDDDGEKWFVSQYCQDGSLADFDTKIISPEDKLEIFLGICRGVAHAHDREIVHRDLKPSNIFLKKGRIPIVGDFGLCHLSEDGERFTLTEEAVGPRNYMAPELEDGRTGSVTSLSDIYSLGKILYWLFTGRV